MVTVTAPLPVVETSPARRSIASWFGLRMTVLRGAPFQLPTVLPKKADPFTVSVNAAWPVVIAPGLRPVMDGAGAMTKGSGEVAMPS